MCPVPKTKSDEIIEQLNGMGFSDPKNYFKLARFKKDAEAFLRDDPSAAYYVLGAIACLERDIEAMHKFHQNGITSSGNNPNAFANYAASLGRLGFVQKCYEQIRETFERDPEPQIAVALVYRSIECGRISEAYAVAQQIPQEARIELKELFDFDGFLTPAAECISQNGLSDNDLSAVVIAVANLFHAHGVYGVSCQVRVVSDGVDPFISYEYSFPFDDVDVFDLDYEIEKELTKLKIKGAIMETLHISLVDEALEQAMLHVGKEIQAGREVTPLSEETMALIDSLVADVEL